MTPEQEIARRKQLRAAVRALLTLQIGMVHGCTRIERCASRLGNDFRETFQTKYPLFHELRIATLNFPTGTERLRWEHKALLSNDRELGKIELLFRPKVMAACIQILDELGEG